MLKNRRLQCRHLVLQRSSKLTEQHLFRLVIVGDAQSGKSNILSRFFRNEFNRGSATIRSEFGTRQLPIDDALVTAQFWCTAGQTRYRAITSAYYRGAVGALLVVNVCDQASVDNVARWIDEIRDHADCDIVTMLMGTHCDDEGVRVCSSEQLTHLANVHGVLCAETSARDGVGIEEAFYVLLAHILALKRRRQAEEAVSPAPPAAAAAAAMVGQDQDSTDETFLCHRWCFH
jgi:Ras-related protein Rab-11A